MRQLLATSLVLLATTASAQTTWTGDHFTVTTDNLTNVNVAGGVVTVADLPDILGMSDEGSHMDPSSSRFDLEFAPLPGYVLLGEQVSFRLFVQVEAREGPAHVYVEPSASYWIDVNGVYTTSQTFGAGSSSVLTPGYFLADPNLVAQVGATTQAGLACPVGHEDDCASGSFWDFQDALVELSGITVTPLLAAAVPEPASGALMLAGLALLAGTRRRAPRGSRAQSAQTTCRPLDVHASKRAA